MRALKVAGSLDISWENGVTHRVTLHGVGPAEGVGLEGLGVYVGGLVSREMAKLAENSQALDEAKREILRLKAQVAIAMAPKKAEAPPPAKAADPMPDLPSMRPPPARTRKGRGS